MFVLMLVQLFYAFLAHSVSCAPVTGALGSPL